MISVPKAVEQAKCYDHSLEREIGYLTAHSMLHLLGYDHETGGLDRVRMREKEELVLSQLGLPSTGSYVLGAKMNRRKRRFSQRFGMLSGEFYTR